MANTLVVLQIMSSNFDVLRRLITKLSTTWLNVTARYNNKGVVTNGMYVTHKPDGHETWTERRNKGRKGGATASTGNDPAGKPTTTPSVSNDSSASKLSLSKSL